MSPRFWLDQLPSTDPSFAPLQLAEQLSEPADWPILAQAHRQARSDAAWGKPLDVLEAQSAELLEVAARLKERDDDDTDNKRLTPADLEALGYALGLTSVRVAIRNHEAPAGIGRAA
jgi:hypothetical protein